MPSNAGNTLSTHTAHAGTPSDAASDAANCACTLGVNGPMATPSSALPPPPPPPPPPASAEDAFRNSSAVSTTATAGLDVAVTDGDAPTESVGEGVDEGVAVAVDVPLAEAEGTESLLRRGDAVGGAVGCDDCSGVAEGSDEALALRKALALKGASLDCDGVALGSCERASRALRVEEKLALEHSDPRALVDCAGMVTDAAPDGVPASVSGAVPVADVETLYVWLPLTDNAIVGELDCDADAQLVLDTLTPAVTTVGVANADELGESLALADTDDDCEPDGDVEDEVEQLDDALDVGAVEPDGDVDAPLV